MNIVLHKSSFFIFHAWQISALKSLECLHLSGIIRLEPPQKYSMNKPTTFDVSEFKILRSNRCPQLLAEKESKSE